MNSAEARNQALGEQHVKEREPDFPSQHSGISLPSWRKKALFQWESLNTQAMRQQASSFALASPEAQLEELQQHVLFQGTAPAPHSGTAAETAAR